MICLKNLVSCVFILVIMFLVGCSNDEPTGGITYIDLNDADVGYNDLYDLDIDADGESEFLFNTVLIADDVGDHLQFRIFPKVSNRVVGADDSVAVVSDGALIGPDAAAHKFNQILAVKITGNDGISWQGAWHAVQNKYIGISFKLTDTGHYYGWVRVSVDTVHEKVIVHDMAYSNTAGVGIKAGGV